MNLNNAQKDVNLETGEEIKRNEYRKMSTYDFVRRDIEKYFAHPEEALVAPELAQPQLPKPPPEFVRNVWGNVTFQSKQILGSAAGVGSGDFHIYRGIRRREYTRLEMIEKTAEEERLDREFQMKQKALNDLAAEKTAKKRAKRQMKKEKRLNKRKLKSKSKSKSGENSDYSDEQLENSAQTESSEFNKI
uniref:PRKR-interacting protein 1-like protein n=1 Tax=Schistosoma haematobium TaxID=6185 RepID=A0A094ZXM0_SCHHA